VPPDVPGLAAYTLDVLERTVLTTKLGGFGTTIFAEMSALAVATGAINLGQGFPDTDGPPEVLDAAVAAIRQGVNQYPPGLGAPELRQAIADHQHRFYGCELDPATEIVVTAGATEALAGALLGMLDSGDEVVVFEPMYDSYQRASLSPVPAPCRCCSAPVPMAATSSIRTGCGRRSAIAPS
jgi:N-succinyldiaminopimelate aminotransferase